MHRFVARFLFLVICYFGGGNEHPFLNLNRAFMVTYPSTAYRKTLLAIIISFFPFFLQAQTIDLSKPVGTTVGNGGVSASGGSTYSIPLYVLPGTNGMQPDVSLVYNSQSGDGIAGWGWNLSCMSAISRAGKSNYYNGIASPVKYTNTNDAFLLDGQRLFVTSGANGADGAVYGQEHENFSKIESFGGSETLGPDWFRVTTKNGVVMEYGHDANTKMTTDDGASTMLWFLNKVTDINGNYIKYLYTISTANRTYALSEIQYTGNANASLAPYNKIVFTYGTRTDWLNSTTYDGGASLRRAYNLTNISIRNAASQTVRSYDLVYQFIKNQYFLKTVTEKGSNGTAFNPLVFSYGADTAAANVATSPQYPNMHKGNVYAGDFNGDSRQDVLSSNYYYDNNNIPHYTSYDVLSDFSSYAGQPAISFFYNFAIPQTGATEVQGTSNGYYNFLTYDYDGDSKEDVLLINSLVSGSDKIFNGIRINYSRNFSVYTGPTYDSVSYPYIPHSISYTQDFKYVYRNGTTFGSYFVPGDFDGDGAQDYILILGINYLNAFKAFFSSPKKGIFNQEILQFGVEGTATDPFYANSVASASQLIPIDFDGDGKQEILVMKSNQSYVLSVFPVAPSTGYNYAAQVLYTVAGVQSNFPVYPGDFNGDGKTDLLYRSSATSSTAGWYLLTSTGKAYTSQAFGFYNRPILPQDNNTSAHHLMVADLNGDGKTDVWHSLDLSTSSSRHTAYYSNGLSFQIEHYEVAVSTNGAVDANTVVGDFNGDGKADILGINASSYGRFIYPRPFREERFLTNVVNGLGAQEGFTYSLINQNGIYSRSAMYEYDTRGTPIGQSANGEPYNVLSVPSYVVSQSYHSNGVGTGLNYTGYQYADLAYSRVRGALGFKKISSTDGATGIQSVVENSIQADLLVPHAVHTYKTVNGVTVSDTKITDTIQALATTYFDKRYVHKVLKTVSVNGITGAAEENTNTYDNYGNITQNVKKTGALSGETVSAIETATTTVVFGTHGTPFPASPDSETGTFVRSGQAQVSKVTTYAYNTTGLVTSKVEFSGKPKALTTTFAYDAFGNIKQSDIAATGVTTRTQKFTYDNTGRFVMTRETAGGTLSKKETFTYDAVFGNMASKVTTDGLTTSYQYDAFNRLAVTTLPEGYSVTQSFTWETTNGRYALNVTRPGGGRNVKGYYDILGREVRTESSGFNSGTLIASKTYNAKGQEAATADPHYSSEAVVTTTTLFDSYGRITQTGNGTGTTTYTYEKLTGGQYRITATKAGQSSIKTMDAAGRVVATTDNGGTLSFTYNSQGKQVQVALNGVTIQTSTYDDYGNQLSLADKNAGTYTYDYDAFQQQVSQKNPLNQTTTSTYDPFGRILTRTGPEGTTTWEYCQTPGSGYCNNGPVKITGFTGETKEFTYDNLQRLSTEKVTVDGTSYLAQYAYDAYSNPVKTTYPSGLIITRTFDHDGTETAAKMGEGTTATSLFTATGMNGLGKYTAYTYGNGKASTETYNMALGVQTQSLTAGIQNLNYTYDLQTGNLTSRKDLIKNLEEVFTYDNLNRLLTTKINNVQQLSVTYDGGTGSSLGNIASKTDAGNYVYNSSKNNAVAFVTNPAGAQTPPAVISQQQQDVVYTAFGKAATITENTYQLTYTYASDYERVKSVMKQNGAVVETKYYIGTYEKQVKGSVTRQLHYIDGGNGLCAIIVTEGTATSVYYTYTDYLGNILTVTNAAGTVVAAQNFDAWGRSRNPDNWTYAGVPAVPDWLYRGFTGHEYIKEFALVNMNGRLYDPVLGRVLSADNNIRIPFSSQAYNRYAYGLNNPLMYTDPDGQFLNLVIGAIIGGVMNVILNHNKIDNFWDGLKYFGVGAAAGALGAGIGAGVSSALAGGSFGAGFIGSQAALTATSSFFSGAAIGGAAGFAGGFVTGLGNRLLDGNSFGEALGGGLKEGIIGGITGGLIGGVASGIDAALKGRRFFDGATVQQRVVVDRQLPYVHQDGEYNCGPACGESLTNGQVTQQQLRAALGGNANANGVGDVNLWQNVAQRTGKHMLHGAVQGPFDLQGTLVRMQAGQDVALTLRTAPVGHSVLINRIAEKVITKVSGKAITKLLLYVMDPAVGQYTPLPTSSYLNANIFYLW